jgi:hypothetical protein
LKCCICRCLFHIFHFDCLQFGECSCSSQDDICSITRNNCAVLCMCSVLQQTQFLELFWKLTPQNMVHVSVGAIFCENFPIWSWQLSHIGASWKFLTMKFWKIQQKVVWKRCEISNVVAVFSVWTKYRICRNINKLR